MVINRTDCDGVAVGHYAGRDPANCENRALRRIDDRDKIIDAEHTEIRDGKGSALVVQREEFFLLRFFDKLAALFAPALASDSRSALRITGTTKPSSSATAMPILMSDII